MSRISDLKRPSIWNENMLGYLSLDIICSSKLTVFLDLISDFWQGWIKFFVCHPKFKVTFLFFIFFIYLYDTKHLKLNEQAQFNCLLFQCYYDPIYIIMTSFIWFYCPETIVHKYFWPFNVGQQTYAVACSIKILCLLAIWLLVSDSRHFNALYIKLSIIETLNSIFFSRIFWERQQI